MARLEEYGLIGDCQTAALVSRDGSIDWLCFPRFDSPALLAALLGNGENGYWSLRPEGEIRSTKRAYRPGTLILDTDYELGEGAVRVTDFMPKRGDHPDLIRIVTGLGGNVRVRMELVPRFDYGSLTPWVTPAESGVRAIAGPDSFHLRTTAPLEFTNERITSRVAVGAGQRVAFDLSWSPSHHPLPARPDPCRALEETETWWRRWIGQCRYGGPWDEAVRRSLITLKALTYEPTGGIVAAPTTSLPEQLGGCRNWDYRYCWVRDATFTLYALMIAGYTEEAEKWRDWLLRAVAGEPQQMHLVYGLEGERRLTEVVLEWLEGYEGSSPVRVGNAASAFPTRGFGRCGGGPVTSPIRR